MRGNGVISARHYLSCSLAAENLGEFSAKAEAIGSKMCLAKLHIAGLSFHSILGTE